MRHTTNKEKIINQHAPHNNGQQSTKNKEQRTNVKQPTPINKHQSTNNGKQTPNIKQPMTMKKIHTTTIDIQHEPISKQQSTTREQRKPDNEFQTSINNQQQESIINK